MVFRKNYIIYSFLGLLNLIEEWKLGCNLWIATLGFNQLLCRSTLGGLAYHSGIWEKVMPTIFGSPIKLKLKTFPLKESIYLMCLPQNTLLPLR